MANARSSEVAEKLKTRGRGRSLKRAVAYHEAGHAVASWHLRIPIGREGVSIVPSKEHQRLGFCAVGKPGYRYSRTRNYQAHNRWIFERHAVVSLSGFAAEERYWTPLPCDIFASTDYQKVQDGMRWTVHFHDADERSAYLKLLQVRAKRLVNEYWLYVEAVAEALIERKQLSPEETLSTISEAFDRRIKKRQVAYAPGRPTPRDSRYWL